MRCDITSHEAFNESIISSNEAVYMKARRLRRWHFEKFYVRK